MFEHKETARLDFLLVLVLVSLASLLHALCHSAVRKLYDPFAFLELDLPKSHNALWYNTMQWWRWCLVLRKLNYSAARERKKRQQSDQK